MKKNLGIPVIPLDARNPSDAARDELATALSQTFDFPLECPPTPALRGEEKRDVFSVPVPGSLLALTLLFAPAWFAVFIAPGRPWENGYVKSLYA